MSWVNEIYIDLGRIFIIYNVFKGCFLMIYFVNYFYIFKINILGWINF